MPPTRMKGNRTKEMTTMPTPPIHCVKALQKRSPWERDSSGRVDPKMLDPVVVKPETDSKKALINEEKEKGPVTSVKKKGRAPSNEAENQERTTRKVASRWDISSSLLFRKKRRNIQPTTMDEKLASQSSLMSTS